MIESKCHDVAIIGGGPGGSTLAALLAKRNIDVVLFEKENFPRFQIGESLLPYSMDIFRESGFFEILSSGKYLEKFGARFVEWKNNEEIYINFENGFDPKQNRAFEVPRAEFDRDLLNWARHIGVKVFQPERISEVHFESNEVRVISDKNDIRARYLVDASGNNCFLGNKLKLKKQNEDLNNVAVYAHYKGVKRATGKKEGDITIGVLKDDGWSWVIPFKGNISSVGVVRPAKYVKDFDNVKDVIRESLSCSRILEDQMKDAELVTPVRTASNYSHTCDSLYGDRWLLLGDAAVFLDPIFSSGVHSAVCSAKFASDAIFKALESKSVFSSVGGKEYEDLIQKGVKRFHSLISLFYGASFIPQMKKTLQLSNVGKAFTSAIAGDVWKDKNVIFERNVL